MSAKTCLRSMAVAVATGRVVAVFLEGKSVVGWVMYRTAGRATPKTVQKVQAWVTDFKPDVMIAESFKTAACKGHTAQTILEAITTIFADADGLDIQLPRAHSYQNKYDEAKALAAKYPAISHLLPEPPPLWMPEPRNMSYFEALSLFNQLNATSGSQAGPKPHAGNVRTS